MEDHDHELDWYEGIPPEVVKTTPMVTTLATNVNKYYGAQESWRPLAGVLNEWVSAPEPLRFIIISVIRRKLKPLGHMAFAREVGDLFIWLPYHSLVASLERKIPTISILGA